MGNKPSPPKEGSRQLEVVIEEIQTPRMNQEDNKYEEDFDPDVIRDR